MNDKEIIEGNRLIAEFMGGRIGNGGTKKYPVYTNTPVTHSGQTQTWTFSSKDFKYHTSWDWLMPVVEKIEKLGYHTRIIHYSGDTMFIIEEGTPQGDGGKYSKTIIDVCYTGYDKIGVTWESVTRFITWYNSLTHKPNNQ